MAKKWTDNTSIMKTSHNKFENLCERNKFIKILSMLWLQNGINGKFMKDFWALTKEDISCSCCFDYSASSEHFLTRKGRTGYRVAWLASDGIVKDKWRVGVRWETSKYQHPIKHGMQKKAEFFLKKYLHYWFYFYYLVQISKIQSSQP